MSIATIILQNKEKPELGRVEIRMPAKEEKLNDALASIDIPYTSPARNCILSKTNLIGTLFEFLKDELVNADELNYLAMRLDSFDGYETEQFKAAAHYENISDIEGLINLTFNTDNYTVVTDFSNLAAVGKKYYLDKHLAVATSEFEKLNTAEIGYNLLQSGKGIVTPFGVAYKHDREIQTLYNGKTFPQYTYSGDTILTVGVVPACADENTDEIAWIELPCAETCIEKARHRLGVGDGNVRIAHIYLDNVPGGIIERINSENETIHSLNDMCRAVATVKPEDHFKLDAACEFAEASAACEVKAIAENISYFELYPNVSNAREYGFRIAENAGTFQYDQSLSEYFDFRALGKDRMEKEYGRFSDCGYTVFKKSPEVLDEILKREQSGGMVMQ